MTESLAERAYGALCAAIAEGELTPGQRIGETTFAAQLGISRTPIREALQRLARDGLVTLDARNGAKVAELSLEAIQELYDLREILEGSAARFAALGATANDLQRLNAILIKETEHGDDPAALAKLNKLFHQALCEAANNRYLSSAVATFSTTLLLLGPTTLAAKLRAGESQAEHRAIVEAIGEGDAERAESLMRAHIRRAREIRIAMVLEEGLGISPTSIA
ncbi:MAG: GntR family transcriptional regulator [Kiloniellaceae bacterium]